MFDSPYAIVKIIAIAAAVVYLIFKFQVISLAVKTFFNRGNKLDDKISERLMNTSKNTIQKTMMTSRARINQKIVSILKRSHLSNLLILK